MPRSLSLLAALAGIAATAVSAHAFMISPIYATPSDWTPAMQQVIAQACSDWTSRIAINDALGVSETPDAATNINVNFLMTHAGTGAGSFLAQWSFVRGGDSSYPFSDGFVHNITVNADYLPLDYISLAPPSTGDGYDFLSIIRHELGHGLGFANFVYLDGMKDRWSTHITNLVFDKNGLNVPMYTDKSHVAVPADLMYFSITTATRKDISPTDIAMLSLALPYIAIPEPASLTLLSLTALTLLQRRRPPKP